MKKIGTKIIATALAAALIVLTACGSQEGASGKDQLARIKEAGKVTIAMEGT